MALTTQEIQLLSFYLSNHQIRVILQDNSTDIAFWINSVPDILNPVANLISVLTLEDKSKFFSLINFNTWYAQFCNKLLTNTTQPSSYPFETSILSTQELDIIGLLLLQTLVENKLTEDIFIDLIQNIIIYTDTPDILVKLGVCLVADGIISQSTLNAIAIEESGTEIDTRWQRLSLSSAPTSQEIETALNL